MPDEAVSDRSASGWAAGHRGAGARPFALFAGGSADRGWVGAGPQADRLAHGVSSSGLLVALDADPDAPGMEGLVPRLLEDAHDADSAQALLRAGAPAVGVGGLRPVVWVLSAHGGWRIELGGTRPDPRPLRGGRQARRAGLHRAGWGGPQSLVDLEEQLRASGPGGVRPIRSLLLAGLHAGRPPTARLGLGSPLTAICVRAWPGHAVGPPLSVDGSGVSRIAELADRVDRQAASGALGQDAVLDGLAAARAGARAEGEHAERQARLMDSQGDDAGAAVRRLVAQAHAGGLAEAALLALLGGNPADPSL